MPKPLDQVLREAVEHREDNFKEQFPDLNPKYQAELLTRELQRVEDESASLQDAINIIKSKQEQGDLGKNWTEIFTEAGVGATLMVVIPALGGPVGWGLLGVSFGIDAIAKHWTNAEDFVDDCSEKIKENNSIRAKIKLGLQELTGVEGGGVKTKTLEERLPPPNQRNIGGKRKKISTKGEMRAEAKLAEMGASASLGNVEPVPSSVPPKPEIDIPPTPKPATPKQQNLNVSPKTEDSKQKETKDKMNGLIEEIAKLQAIQANPDIDTNPEQTKKKLVSAQEELISLYYKSKYPDSNTIDPEIVKKDPELRAYVDSIPKDNVTMKEDGSGRSFSLSADEPTRKKAREDLVTKLVGQIKEEQSSPPVVPPPAKEPEKKETETSTQVQPKKESKQPETTTTKTGSGTRSSAKIPEATKKKDDSEVFYPRSTITLDDLIEKSPGFKQQYIEPKEEKPTKEPITVEPKDEKPIVKTEAEPIKKKEQEKVSTVQIKTEDGKVKTKSSNDLDYNPDEIRSLIMQLARMNDSDMKKLMEKRFENELEGDSKQILVQAAVEDLKTKKKMADTYLSTKDPTTKKDIEKWFASMIEGIESNVETKTPKETKPDEIIEPPAPKTEERMDKEVSAETSSSDRRSNEELNVVRSSLVEDKMASRETTTTPMVIPIPMPVSGRGGGNTTEAQYNTIPLLVVNDEEVIRMNSFEASKLRMV